MRTIRLIARAIDYAIADWLVRTFIRPKPRGTIIVELEDT